jgi:hypothetical protein
MFPEVFYGRGDGQDGTGEHGQGDSRVPGGPAADLVLFQAGQAFTGLELLLDRPARPSDLDQGGQRDRPRAAQQKARSPDCDGSAKRLIMTTLRPNQRILRRAGCGGLRVLPGRDLAQHPRPRYP